jgi:hypothetical protein
LETVFQRFLEHTAKTGDNDSYVRFQYLVNILFHDLSVELQKEFAASAYFDLVEGIGRLKNPENAKFISFNYEPWLEKALFKKGLWEPVLGYSGFSTSEYLVNSARLTANTGAPNYISLEKSPTVKKRPVTVLKPNGSLTWWEADWSVFKASPNRQLFVTVDSSGCVSLYRDPNILGVIHPAHGEHSHLGTVANPLIHPPTFSKYRAHKIDWDVDREIIEELSVASTIVVIGWSMPSGDNHFGKLLEYSLVRRMRSSQGQPPRLIICDKAESDFTPAFNYHCYRLNSAFRCYESIKWSKGFTKEFVEFLMKELAGY